MSIQEVTSLADLQSKIAGAHKAVVKFYLTGCSHCKAIAPAYASLASSEGGKVSFFQSEINGVPDAAAAYNVEGGPTFVYFVDGREVSRSVGADYSTLSSNVNNLILMT